MLVYRGYVQTTTPDEAKPCTVYFIRGAILVSNEKSLFHPGLTMYKIDV